MTRSHQRAALGSSTHLHQRPHQPLGNGRKKQAQTQDDEDQHGRIASALIQAHNPMAAECSRCCHDRKCEGHSSKQGQAGTPNG
jgi:hypothetical protein